MRLIDADALKKEMLETYEYEYPTASGAFDEFAIRIVPNIISNAPTVDAEPVRHGHWVRIKYVEGDWMRCSACEENIWTTGEFAGLGSLERFCPHCGAKMDEVSE